MRVGDAQAQDVASRTGNAAARYQSNILATSKWDGYTAINRSPEPRSLFGRVHHVQVRLTESTEMVSYSLTPQSIYKVLFIPHLLMNNIF